MSATVLIVDDSDFDLMPLEAILTGVCGVTVAQATSGQEAIDKFKADRGGTSSIKLIFMDVNMPGIDGLQATQQILALAAQNKAKPVKVVGVTSFESDDALQKCFDSGMVNVVSKPIDVDRLTDVFEQYYNK